MIYLLSGCILVSPFVGWYIGRKLLQREVDKHEQIRNDWREFLSYLKYDNMRYVGNGMFQSTATFIA